METINVVTRDPFTFLIDKSLRYTLMYKLQYLHQGKHWSVL